MRLLLVEDDDMIGDGLHQALRLEQYAVDWVRDGQAAELALNSHQYDLILLDLGLPKKSGTQVLTQYRQKGGNAPIIVITARDATEDRVKGLDGGADDYLVKPFNIDELLARIRALLRRHNDLPTEVVFGGITLNPVTHTVTLHQQPITLSAREFAVLHMLMYPPGRVVSRAKLEEKLYGWGEEVASNTIEVFIHGLRKKLGTSFIVNVHRVGYKLINPT